ncbi:MAG TPA: Bax inhibitor-1/YccA family protein, partial [Acidobacteriaceae bacterium]
RRPGVNRMALMKTSNPALGDKTFTDLMKGGQFGDLADAARMTLSGTVNKTGILLLCTICTAAYTWRMFVQAGDASAVGPLVLVGALGGFVLAMVTIFKKEWAPVTAPIYALLEGVALGGISAVTNARYPGIGIQAVSLTFGTLFVLLLAYQSGLIKVTDKLRLGIVAATGGIAAFYVLELLLSFAGIRFAAINGSGWIGIGFSLFVVAIAALNLVLDFDFIEQGVAVGAPKYMEWYGAFGIMVTLVWLYLEILRLLSKMRSRN